MTDLSKYDDRRDRLNDGPTEALFKLFSVGSTEYAAALTYAAVVSAESGEVDVDDMQLIIREFETARLSLMPLLLVLIGAVGVSVENGEVCIGLIRNDYDEAMRQLKRHEMDTNREYAGVIQEMVTQPKVVISRQPEERKSAMSLLPADVRERILSGNAEGLRPDLVVIPVAEALGWTVSFQGDNWHSAVRLSKGNIRIWQSARGWRRALLVNDEYANHTVHASIEMALHYKIDHTQPKEQNDNTQR